MLYIEEGDAFEAKCDLKDKDTGAEFSARVYYAVTGVNEESEEVTMQSDTTKMKFTFTNIRDYFFVNLIH